MSAHRKLTQAELLSEATDRFGPDPMQFAFQCPHCDDIATFADFVLAGAEPGRAGRECIGRSLGSVSKSKYKDVDAYRAAGERGCDWVAYGLFRGPWEIVIPAEGDKPERSVWGFPLAPAPGGES